MATRVEVEAHYTACIFYACLYNEEQGEGLPAPHTQPLTAAACSAMPIAPGNIVATHTLIQPIAQILEWSATDGRSP